MTAKITIVVETDRKDATWTDVLEAISYAGSPGQKSRPVHKNDHTTEWGNAFGRYFNAPRIEGIKVATKLEVSSELPTGLGAVVRIGGPVGGYVLTRTGSASAGKTGRWHSSSGKKFIHEEVEELFANAPASEVLFEGVQE